MQNPDNFRLAVATEDLAILAYRYTAAFPHEELYGLTSQMRRAAISVGSNFFEGCGRQTNKAFAASLYSSFSEAGELLFQLRVATRLKMGDAAVALRLRQALENVRRMLTRLIQRLESDTRRPKMRAVEQHASSGHRQPPTVHRPLPTASGQPP
jgi:four helix bundle protein